jgi:glycosyltransferase involved in cell wall biosynthesis
MNNKEMQRIIEIPDLEEFVAEGYRRILHREADSESATKAIRRLRFRPFFTRRRFLRSLIFSEENHILLQSQAQQIELQRLELTEQLRLLDKQRRALTREKAEFEFHRQLFYRREAIDAQGAAVEFLEEKAEMCSWPCDVDQQLVKPWPREPISANPPQRLEAFLFLQVAYSGGVWEAAKTLILELVEVNRERDRLSLTLGIHEDQTNAGALELLGDSLKLERIRLNPISRQAVRRMLGENHPNSLGTDSSFCFFSGGSAVALRADAWFGLVDRFPFPLLPVRPYGIIVHDMLQKYLPENFGGPNGWFFRWMKKGMKPTAEAAHLIIVTNPHTRNDALAEYDLNPDRVRLLPVGWDARRSFENLTPERAPVPMEPFILNVTNASPHKGGGVMVQAHARLKERLGGKTPPLVMTGWMTQAFSPQYKGVDDPAFQKVRELVHHLGLEVGRDVYFLGLISDRQLLDLYQRCSVLVNAAKFDNGSYCLLEATYFGRPVISSRYAAVEYFCKRFGIGAHFFPIDDHVALADLLEGTLRNKPLEGAELTRVRARLAEPELSARRHAESFYDYLLELAEAGRRQRTGLPSHASAP